MNDGIRGSRRKRNNVTEASGKFQTGLLDLPTYAKKKFFERNKEEFTDVDVYAESCGAGWRAIDGFLGSWQETTR